MPTIKTVKPDGTGDFTTLAAWASFAATQANADQWAECYTGNLGVVGLFGWASTPTASVYPRIYGAPGHRPDASKTSTAGARIDVPADAAAVDSANNLPYLEVDGITFSLVASDLTKTAVTRTSVTFKNTKTIVNGTGVAPFRIFVLASASAGATVINVLNNALYVSSTAAVAVSAAGAIQVRADGTSACTTLLANNSVDVNGKLAGCYDVFNNGGTHTGTIVNNIGVGGSSYCFGITGGSDTPTYNIESAAALSGFAGAANNQSGVTAAQLFQINSFALLPTAPARNAGTVTTVTTDLLGTARPQGPSYDIGAIEGVIGPSGVGQIIGGAATLIGNGDWAE